MLHVVHCGVTPSIKIASTHLTYNWQDSDNLRVKGLAQGHNTWCPGLSRNGTLGWSPDWLIPVSSPLPCNKGATMLPLRQNSVVSKYWNVHPQTHVFLLFMQWQVSCGKCGNGLGHEFIRDSPDGVSSRFWIFSDSLQFVPMQDEQASESTSSQNAAK